jgi:hypothetical protein
MGSRKALASCSLILILTLLFAVLVVAQMIPLNRFKGINIPVSLKIQDKTLGKGVYDLEIRRNSTPVFYYAGIMKSGKTLGLVQGGEWPYGIGIASDPAVGRDIPDKPTLKMAKNTDEKLFIIIFESGKSAGKYPRIRAKFKFPYEE